MKNFYTLVTFFTVSLFLQKSSAQCTCSDGSTPDSLSYSQYFDSIVTTNTTISFPQFNPAIGTLTCFKLSDTVSTVVSYNLQNNLPDTTIYNFETFRRSQFTGPGSFFTSVTSTPKDFGPYILSPMDSAGDNVDIGPDTVFNKRVSTKYGTSNPAFYGTGTVDFNYLNTSTFTILTGSDNAIFILRAYTRLNVTLVYYWCPATVLETHLTNFTASLLNNNILLQWKVNGQDPGDKYEIEVSTDGKEFKNLGEGIFETSGSLASYNLLYTPDKNFTGNLLFRIKRTDKDEKIFYSEIRTASINNQNNTSYSLYPNPSITGIHIQFSNNAGGDYEVELINSYGQSNFRKRYSFNKSGALNIEWPNKPAAGIYFLKVTDLKNNTQQVERLKIM